MDAVHNGRHCPVLRAVVWYRRVWIIVLLVMLCAHACKQLRKVCEGMTLFVAIDPP